LLARLKSCPSRSKSKGKTIRHKAKVYVDGEVHTNTVGQRARC
jgi:uncharacterized metal-binding protein YceD (DUF177 family)